MGDLRRPHGGSSSSLTKASASASASAGGREGGEEEDRPATLLVSSSDPISSITPRRWVRAEKATQNIISQVQPTAVAGGRRREVIYYVQSLIRKCLGCEVIPYGSVPLKTYLPDGDIDLTAFGATNAEDFLVDDMVSVLEREDHIKSAVVVKDIQVVRAEVKLVKCIVQNIVVDISFNQIGGLCTLCFLELVDSVIGKEHLFKRSIILIKAWCYYESRVLGAHHGLISTYGLETLVLYIFHLFHSTLNGPLAVLFKFLDYFSKFDWENYCISLNGPVRLSSLPELVVEAPENGGSDLLLSSDFLRYCTDVFSVPSRGVDSNSRVFQPKHLNIVDPLKENNNLGRSVSKGNFYRIRSAFTYGARKLGRILQQPEDDIADGLCKFFFNTLDRHGSGQRPDVQGLRSNCRYNGHFSTISNSENGSCTVERSIVDPISHTNGSCNDGVNDLKPELETRHRRENEEEEGTMEVLSSNLCASPAAGSSLDHRISGDAKDLAAQRVHSLKVSNTSPQNSELIGSKSASSVGTPYPAPLLYYPSPILNNGRPAGTNNRCGLEENLVVSEDEDPAAIATDALRCATRDLASESANIAETFSTLSELDGDFDSHLNYLQYGRWCYECALSTPVPSVSPPPAVFQWNNSWDPVQHPSQFKQNIYSSKGVNGVIPNPAFCTVNPILIPGVAVGLEDMPKPRGTGTYFPNMIRLPQGYRPLGGKGRNQALPRSPRNNNGRNLMFVETNMVDQSSSDLSQSPGLDDRSSSDKLGPSNIHQSFSPRGKAHRNVNGVIMQSEGGFEIGPVGDVPVEAHQLERGRHHRQRYPENSGLVSPTRDMRKLKPDLKTERDRVSVELSYQLKDEDDFPPLSV